MGDRFRMRVTIEKAIYGGASLARVDGKAVFVPMALPGETVDVAPRRERGSFAEADLLEVLAPSPERVAPGCPFYGPCGGCQYQHAGYAEQLAIKRAILAETLTRAGLRELPAIAVHAGEPWGYRNRIRLHVDARTHALGYRQRSSHTLLPVDACPIAAPLLANALRAAAVVFARLQASSWCSELELFTDANSSALLLSAKLRAGVHPARDALVVLSEAMRVEIPQLVGAGLFPAAERAQNARRGRSQSQALASDADGEDASRGPVARWGEPALTYTVGDDAYRVSLGSFFQGNRFLTPKLRALATEGAGGELAWDLFAGVGLFGRALARSFQQVVAVEGSPISSGDLRRNLPEQASVESSTLAFLQSRARSGRVAGRIVPDLVVLDPPRAGLGVDASRLLAQIGPPHITYVSCDPATLARDLRILADAGYTIAELHLVDMFPQTFHLETVAKLRRV